MPTGKDENRFMITPNQGTLRSGNRRKYVDGKGSDGKDLIGKKFCDYLQIFIWNSRC